MTYVDSLISTGVDQLINLVYKERRVSIEKAAVELGIAQKVIEEWARILEGEGIVRIDYQFTSAYLVWAGEVIAEPEKVKELKEQRDSLVNEVEGLYNKVSGLIAESRKTEGRLADVVGKMASVSTGVQTSVDTINEIKKESARANKEASSMIKELEFMIKSVSSKVEGYEKALNEADASFKKDSREIKSILSGYSELAKSVQQQFAGLNAQKSRLDKSLAEISERELQIKERINTYSRLEKGAFKEEISKTRSDFEAIKKMYSSLNATLEKRLSEMRLALKTIKDFSKDVEELESRVNEDVIARRYNEIKNMMDILTGLEEEEEMLGKKLKLLIDELRSIKIEVSPHAAAGTEKKIREAKGKIKSAKREVTLLEQKRNELIALMKRIKKEK